MVSPLEFKREGEADGFVEAILATHDEEIGSGGGYLRDDERPSPGSPVHSRAMDTVAAVVDSVFVEHYGLRPSDRFADIFEQASYFALHLASDHPFGDANKRTTVRMSFAIITKGGISLDLDDSSKAEDNEVYQWIQRLVLHQCDYKELAHMLREHAILD